MREKSVEMRQTYNKIVQSPPTVHSATLMPFDFVDTKTAPGVVKIPVPTYADISARVTVLGMGVLAHHFVKEQSSHI